MSPLSDWLDDHTFTIAPQFSLTSRRGQAEDPGYVLPDVLLSTWISYDGRRAQFVTDRVPVCLDDTNSRVTCATFEYIDGI